MLSEEIKKRYYSLIDEITRHDIAYYVKEEPLISDYEYDKLMEELKTIESKYTANFNFSKLPAGDNNSIDIFYY